MTNHNVWPSQMEDGGHFTSQICEKLHGILHIYSVARSLSYLFALYSDLE